MLPNSRDIAVFSGGALTAMLAATALLHYIMSYDPAGTTAEGQTAALSDSKNKSPDQAADTSLIITLFDHLLKHHKFTTDLSLHHAGEGAIGGDLSKTELRGTDFRLDYLLTFQADEQAKSKSPFNRAELTMSFHHVAGKTKTSMTLSDIACHNTADFLWQKEPWGIAMTMASRGLSEAWDRWYESEAKPENRVPIGELLTAFIKAHAWGKGKYEHQVRLHETVRMDALLAQIDPKLKAVLDSMSVILPETAEMKVTLQCAKPPEPAFYQ